jgi:hypothetical protein
MHTRNNPKERNTRKEVEGITTTILTRRVRPMLNQNNNTERKEDPLPLDRPGLPDLPNQNT